MSADNYLLLRKEQDYWVGFLESASKEPPTYQNMAFKVTTLEDALRHVRKTDTEYGMRFIEEEIDAS